MSGRISFPTKATFFKKPIDTNPEKVNIVIQEREANGKEAPNEKVEESQQERKGTKRKAKRRERRGRGLNGRKPDHFVKPIDPAIAGGGKGTS